MNLSFLLPFVILFYQQGDHRPVSFTEEYIEFRLSGTTFTVNGNYYFVNHSGESVSKIISYPFPVALSCIDSIHIFNLDDGKYISYEKTRQAAVFHLDCRPGDTVRLNIFYKQTNVTDTVRYILTTTKNWKQPLKKAEYTFTTESSRKILSFSYPPDKSSLKGREQKYFWSRKEFLPDRDFVVILKR
jgi:hypothetical protein